MTTGLVDVGHMIGDHHISVMAVWHHADQSVRDQLVVSPENHGADQDRGFHVPELRLCETHLHSTPVSGMTYLHACGVDGADELDTGIDLETVRGSTHQSFPEDDHVGGVEPLGSALRIDESRLRAVLVEVDPDRGKAVRRGVMRSGAGQPGEHHGIDCS